MSHQARDLAASRRHAAHTSMLFRMLVRAAILRRGRAASALFAMVVAAAVTTAMLNLYVDVQAKLRAVAVEPRVRHAPAAIRGAFNQHFGGARAGIVVGGLHEAVGTGGQDGDERLLGTAACRAELGEGARGLRIGAIDAPRSPRRGAERSRAHEHGIRFFGGLDRTVALHLKEAKAYKSGMVALCYACLRTPYCPS